MGLELTIFEDHQHQKLIRSLFYNILVYYTM